MIPRSEPSDSTQSSTERSHRSRDGGKGSAPAATSQNTRPSPLSTNSNRSPRGSPGLTLTALSGWTGCSSPPATRKSARSMTRRALRRVRRQLVRPLGGRTAAVSPEPADTVAPLLRWMANDQYGFWSHVEGSIASALDEAGRAACAGHIERVLDTGTEPAPYSTNPQFRVFLRHFEAVQAGADAVAGGFRLGPGCPHRVANLGPGHLADGALTACSMLWNAQCDLGRGLDCGAAHAVCNPALEATSARARPSAAITASSTLA